MERKKGIEKIISVVRYSTVLVKAMPFFFAFFYLVGIFSYIWMPKVYIGYLDLAFYVSPIVILYELILSKIFHLCKWHRLECVLPLSGLIPVIVDKFIIEVGAYGQLVNWIIVVAVFTLSLINAYFVFLKD
jgi:hypothetical protein